MTTGMPIEQKRACAAPNFLRFSAQPLELALAVNSADPPNRLATVSNM
jgi:hypothetical protein